MAVGQRWKWLGAEDSSNFERYEKDYLYRLRKSDDDPQATVHPLQTGLPKSAYSALKFHNLGMMRKRG